MKVTRATPVLFVDRVELIEVDDLGAVIALPKGSKVIVERHTTFYKSDELTFEEPGGNLVTLARFA